MSDNAWKVFNLDDLISRTQGKDPCFLEYIRMPGLCSAVYFLPAGAKDMQAPHLEDEMYFVISGSATLRVRDSQHEVGPGSILYVRATQEHSFFDIDEDLTLLAFFGSADFSLEKKAG